jgi:molybdopterin adenylyltransferase
MMSAAVLTISDGAHHGTRTDTSGPAIAARLEAAGFTVVERKIVPDERDQISTQLRYLADLRLAGVVFTTGGTGVAPRDVTPEATRDVIEREIPGFGELMRSKGRASSRFAPLSRGLAGSRGSVLIVKARSSRWMLFWNWSRTCLTCCLVEPGTIPGPRRHKCPI